MEANSQFHFSQFFEETGILKDFFESRQYPWEVMPHISEFIDNFAKNLPSDYQQISEGVFIGKNVMIDDTARIKGKAIIGHGATIGHAAFLRGDVVIGEDVNVGHATEVKHSIILARAALAHLNYIGDSVVGSDSNISGGATMANWRFDRAIVTVKNGDERISTGMEKFGSIIGDGTFVGVSAVINPGTVLAKKTLVFPLISVSGSHLAQSTIK